MDKGRQFTFECKEDNKSHVTESCNLKIVESRQYTDLGIYYIQILYGKWLFLMTDCH